MARASMARWTAVATSVLLLAFFPLSGWSARAAVSETLVPVGGGYSESALEGYALAVIQHAGGTTVIIDVIPSAYGGNNPESSDNEKLAGQRTQDIQSACNAVVGSYPQFTGGCQAILLQLFDRSQASNPANSASLNDPATNGAFFLGGDQDFAMQALAGTPAEAAMSNAYSRGVVFGGTSAGAAMLSHSMIYGDLVSNGDSAAYGLQKNAVAVWWSDDTDQTQRGLSFGSNNAIFDSHFDQRGRLGRLLNVIAQSGAHFGTPRLGVGVDYQTGASVTNDSTISNLFGDTSAVLVDYKTLNASYTWVGPNATLSARNVVTDLMAPGDGVTYTIPTRTATRNGKPIQLKAPPGWGASVLHAPGPGALILGGDLSTDFSGPAMTDFVNRAKATGSTVIYVITAGYSNPNAAQSAANNYASGLNSAGWSGSQYKVVTVGYGTPAWSSFTPGQMAGAAGVIIAGGDQSALAGPLGDAAFANTVRYAVANDPVVLVDNAMTAGLGAWYDALPTPGSQTLQSSASAAFDANNAVVQPGLGILPDTFEPRLTVDQRWGRLYGMSMAHPGTIVLGIGDGTAVTLDASGAHVTGGGSVVALDGRAATFGTGSNGAISAYNTIVDVFGAGDTVVANR